MVADTESTAAALAGAWRPGKQGDFVGGVAIMIEDRPTVQQATRRCCRGGNNSLWVKLRYSCHWFVVSFGGPTRLSENRKAESGARRGLRHAALIRERGEGKKIES